MSRTFTDQMGRKVTVPDRPKRIVSLVPSQTELLSDLGLGEEVVGITRFCIHPERWKDKTRVGGTKKINHDVLRSLAPDLVIGNKEENSRDDMEQLFREYNVWMSDISCLEDALDMMTSVGNITGRGNEALDIRKKVSAAFDGLEPPVHEPLRALYLIWYNPWMGAGDGTFIGDMMKRCGLINVLSGHSRYPELPPEEITALKPDVVLLSSEPFPFRDRHAAAIRELAPAAAVHPVDGELFSWYGSRLLLSPAYFHSLREVFP